MFVLHGNGNVVKSSRSLDIQNLPLTPHDLCFIKHKKILFFIVIVF